MLLECANVFVWEMFYMMHEGGVIIIPGFDAALSKGEADDRGRIYRAELNWDKDDVESIAREFKLEELGGIRRVAEFIIEKLDEMGVCVVSDVLHRDMIRPRDIYKYAYLNTDLAMKVIHDNPLELIEKIGQSH